MSVRSEVYTLAALGPMPSEAAMTEEVVAGYQVHIQAIKPPLNRDEAELLMTVFGPDDGYGLAWTLLHLIESAPTGELWRSKPTELDNEWIRSLWDRSHR